MVGGVPPQSIREDTRIKELHQMPEYGIDAIFALYESKCILVGVALRSQVKAEIVCQNKFYKCRYELFRVCTQNKWRSLTAATG